MLFRSPILNVTLRYRGDFSATFKIGYRGTFRSRGFEARRFRFLPVQAGSVDFRLPANELLGPGNIRPDGFVVRENTRGTDTYDANMDIHGAFAAADVALGSRWRLNGGVRIEDTVLVQKNVAEKLTQGPYSLGE